MKYCQDYFVKNNVGDNILCLKSTAMHYYPLTNTLQTSLPSSP